MRTKRLIILSFLLTILVGEISSQTKTYQYKFLDPSLSLDARVDDLVGRLTLEEKVSQMEHNSVEIQRLGIPAYNWWNECLHGVGRSGDNVTVFPQAIGMAATFNSEAIRRMGEITSDEARAIYYDAIDKGEYGTQYKGLTFWSPNVNIFRDPRWGRGQETYGEDPYLTSLLGKNFVEGLQGTDPQRLKVSACAKHYAVHSGPEFGRHTFDVTVSDEDLWNTYLPAFEDLVVDANVSSVMCAYNRYDGTPCCGDDLLMTQILREKWSFDGYVTSDCGAIDNFYKTHKTHPNAMTASADAVIHGTDLDCGNDAYRALVKAVNNGLITESQLDVSIKRLFKIRFRLGMFDPVENDPYRKLTYDILEAPDHQEHALKMARESMVLLTNKDNILPLSKKYKKILVMGPNANDDQVQLGNYNGFPSHIVTPLDGIKNTTDAEVIYLEACSHTSAITSDSALQAMLENVDLVIFVGGISPRLEGEEGDAGKDGIEGFKGGDRTSIGLPSVQTDIMKQVKNSNIPLVFINMSGSAIAFDWEAQHADAILQAWYGGQSAGTAIADILWGRYNPSGRLPVTFYRSDTDLPHFHDYSMANRTYRYFAGKPLFAFGHGLSYTQFDYSWDKKPAKSYTRDKSLNIRFNLKNKGKVHGEEVAQVYVKYPNSDIELPIMELKDIERTSLSPKQKETIELDIPISRLKKWDGKTKSMLAPLGEYEIFIGRSSGDLAISAKFVIHQ